MTKKLSATALSLGLLTLTAIPSGAQGPSLPAERAIRQGDTIEWVVDSGTHKLRLGQNGASSVNDLKLIMEGVSSPFPAGPSADIPPNGASSGTLFSAKVLDNATVGKAFTFTCGFHPTQMLSEKFTIAAKVAGQPARTHRIRATSTLHWMKEVTRDVQIDTAP